MLIEVDRDVLAASLHRRLASCPLVIGGVDVEGLQFDLFR